MAEAEPLLSNGDLEEQQQHVPPSSTSQQPQEYNLSTRLAADRTYMAADRTAIAWVRTALSMIAFGITLAKGADLLQQQGLVDDTSEIYVFGMLFVIAAIGGLVMVIIQNYEMERRLATTGYPRVEKYPMGLFMAIFMLLICMVGIGVVLVDRFFV